jgi:hypothetical protein
VGAGGRTVCGRIWRRGFRQAQPGRGGRGVFGGRRRAEVGGGGRGVFGGGGGLHNALNY